MSERRQVTGAGGTVGHGPLAEGGRVHRVVAPPFAREEILVDGLLEERVTERVQGRLALGRRDDDPGRHRLPHRRFHAFIVGAGDVT